MRIGILTLPLHTNYGGILQAYALQTVLERMGHEVEVIDKSRYRYLPWYKRPIVYPIRIIKKLVGIKSVGVFYESWWNKCLQRDVITLQHTKEFINKYIHLRHINSFSEIKNSDYDAFVVGSDQIWRQKYSQLQMNDIYAPFLNFTKGWNVKRMSYGASFGTDSWEYSSAETNICKKLLNKFNAVSVREISGVELCRKYLKYNDAIHVIDPTMLLDIKDYLPLFDGIAAKSSGNLLCYVLDQSEAQKQFVTTFSQMTNLKPFNVNSKVDDWNALLEERVQPPVEQWLQGFYDAEYVLTDSFHACVFSILFKKPFYVIGNEKRGLTRFASLLSMFGLQDRLITDNCNHINLTPIDYQKVYSTLNDKRNESFEFLKKIYDPNCINCNTCV